MMSRHLSEEELQMVANSEQVADTSIKQHIESCGVCQEQLEVYKLIVSTVKEQPKTTFDFDLADTVLQQLQPAQAKKVFNLRPFIIAAFTAISLYLFRKNFFMLTIGIPATFLLLSVVASIIIIGTNIFKLYHIYQHKLKQLNISE